MNDEQRKMSYAVVRSEDVVPVAVEDLPDGALEDYVVILELMLAEGRPVGEKLALAQAELARRVKKVEE